MAIIIFKNIEQNYRILISNGYGVKEHENLGLKAMGYRIACL